MAGEKTLNNSRQQGISKAKMGLTKKDAYLSNWNKALLRDERTTKSHNVSRQSCTVVTMINSDPIHAMHMVGFLSAIYF